MKLEIHSRMSPGRFTRWKLTQMASGQQESYVWRPVEIEMLEESPLQKLRQLGPNNFQEHWLGCWLLPCA